MAQHITKHPPIGAALALIVLSAALGAVSWAIVIARVVLRRKLKQLGLDDWLMVAGLVPFTGMFVSAMMLAYSSANVMYIRFFYSSKMWYVLVQIFYAVSTAPIRSSLAAALLRFTQTQQKSRHILYFIIFITNSAAIVAFVGSITQARPLASLWESHLWELQTSINQLGVLPIQWFSYMMVAVSIILDFTIAVMPAVILWHVRLARNVKRSLAILLALGASASMATMAALIFMMKYRVTRFPHPVGGRVELTLCYILELGIGIIAGSVVAVKPLFTEEEGRPSGTRSVPLVPVQRYSDHVFDGSRATVIG